MSEPSYVKIADVMSPSVRTVEAMATVAEAIALMCKHEVSSLVVERRDESDEFGLIVVSDIAREVIAQNRAPERVNVYEVMSKPVLTLSANMNIKYAVRLLSQFGLSRALVVTDSRRPIGLVTVRDMVLRYLGAHKDGSVG